MFKTLRPSILPRQRGAQCAAALGLALGLSAAPALAAGSSCGASSSVCAEPSAHHAPESANAVTLKLAALEEISAHAGAEHGAAGEAGAEAQGTATVNHLAVAFSFERTLVEGWFALELNALLYESEGRPTLPLELFLKKPFELDSIAEPFVGVGLAAEWLDAGEYEPRYGIASELGSYFWLDSHVGLVLESEYSLLLTREVQHEFALATGGALRF